MKETKGIQVGHDKWNVVEFESIKEFCDYICNTPTNNAFQCRCNSLSSHKSNHKNWSGTDSFDEAVDLLKNGWDAGAAELTQKLKFAEAQKDVQMQYKNILGMCGYQAIVPLYLNGVPQNMANKQLTPVKQKVITINKVTSVSCSVSSETIKEESIKCFQIIKKIEASGIRVNLNLVISSGHVCVKIKLKKASEKLNISKLAFPLVHPAMLRRLYFRFIEVYPTIPSSFIFGYGTVPSESKFKAVCDKCGKGKEIILPTLLKGHSEDEIQRLSVDELIARFN